ncbi:hypothetical protein ADUPG1_011144 [Aduncisulcus paluster]|uniref:WW domain-containing protein n=1 Tax=Aduncisulcus paluster TaxID=2918883 RepID=A0ABQ5JXY9_9EUKA|nr:hypothetical protein ADUPG1_011144 [Aduncisulcus paluster]
MDVNLTAELPIPFLWRKAKSKKGKDKVYYWFVEKSKTKDRWIQYSSWEHPSERLFDDLYSNREELKAKYRGKSDLYGYSDPFPRSILLLYSMAAYLSIDPHERPDGMWIPALALYSPMPPNWRVSVNENTGKRIFTNDETGEQTNVHPGDMFYQSLAQKLGYTTSFSGKSPSISSLVAADSEQRQWIAVACAAQTTDPVSFLGKEPEIQRANNVDIMCERFDVRHLDDPDKASECLAITSSSVLFYNFKTDEQYLLSSSIAPQAPAVYNYIAPPPWFEVPDWLSDAVRCLRGRRPLLFPAAFSLNHAIPLDSAEKRRRTLSSTYLSPSPRPRRRSSFRKTGSTSSYSSSSTGIRVKKRKPQSYATRDRFGAMPTSPITPASAYTHRPITSQGSRTRTPSRQSPQQNPKHGRSGLKQSSSGSEFYTGNTGAYTYEDHRDYRPSHSSSSPYHASPHGTLSSEQAMRPPSSPLTGKSFGDRAMLDDGMGEPFLGEEEEDVDGRDEWRRLEEGEEEDEWAVAEAEWEEEQEQKQQQSHKHARDIDEMGSEEDEQFYHGSSSDSSRVNEDVFAESKKYPEQPSYQHGQSQGRPRSQSSSSQSSGRSSLSSHDPLIRVFTSEGTGHGRKFRAPSVAFSDIYSDEDEFGSGRKRQMASQRRRESDEYDFPIRGGTVTMADLETRSGTSRLAHSNSDLNLEEYRFADLMETVEGDDISPQKVRSYGPSETRTSSGAGRQGRGRGRGSEMSYRHSRPSPSNRSGQSGSRSSLGPRQSYHEIPHDESFDDPRSGRKTAIPRGYGRPSSQMMEQYSRGYGGRAKSAPGVRNKRKKKKGTDATLGIGYRKVKVKGSAFYGSGVTELKLPTTDMKGGIVKKAKTHKPPLLSAEQKNTLFQEMFMRKYNQRRRYDIADRSCQHPPESSILLWICLPPPPPLMLFRADWVEENKNKRTGTVSLRHRRLVVTLKTEDPEVAKRKAYEAIRSKEEYHRCLINGILPTFTYVPRPHTSISYSLDGKSVNDCGNLLVGDFDMIEAYDIHVGVVVHLLKQHIPIKSCDSRSKRWHSESHTILKSYIDRMSEVLEQYAGADGLPRIHLHGGLKDCLREMMFKIVKMSEILKKYRPEFDLYQFLQSQKF